MWQLQLLSCLLALQPSPYGVLRMLIQHSEPLERLLSRGLPERLNEGQDHRCDNHCPAHESNVDVDGFHGSTAGAESLIRFLSS